MLRYTRFLIIQLIFLFVVKGFAQNGDKQAELKPTVPAFMYTSQIEILGKVYVVKVEKKAASDIYKYEVTITAPVAAAASEPATNSTTATTDNTTSATETPHSFKLIELKPDVFRSEFINAIKKFTTSSSDTSVAAGEARMELLRKEADRLFYSVVATSFDTEPKAPSAGYMTFDNFKSKGENREPVVIAHDYFSYYAGIGWSKNKLLESVAKNTRDLYKVRDTLIELYVNRTVNPMSDSVAKDSIEIKFDLEETKVKKMLTDAQRSYLRSRGYGEEELWTMFPRYIGSERYDSTGIRKPSKQLSVVIENIQNSLANIKGEIRVLKIIQNRTNALRGRKKTLDSLQKALNHKYYDLLTKQNFLQEQEYKTFIENYSSAYRKWLEQEVRFFTVVDDLQEERKRREDSTNLLKSNPPDSTRTDTILAAEQEKLKSYISGISNTINQLENDSLQIKQRLDSGSRELQRLNRSVQSYANEAEKELRKKKDEYMKAQNSIRDTLNKPNLSSDQRKRLYSYLEGLQQSQEAIQKNLDAIDQVNKAKEGYASVNIEIDKVKKEVQKAEDDLNAPIVPEGLRVHALQVEFSAGNLKNIIVIGTMKSNGHNREDSIKFINQYPIPFSAIRDFNSGAQLYSFNHRNPPKNYRYWIHLSDVFRYVPTFYVDAEDYSPADVAFTVKMDDKQASYKILNRSTVDKLLDARIYSDFVGLDDDTPNGLIQTEVSKRILLRHARQPIIMNRRPVGFGGFFNYIEPHAALLKIENKNKYLKVNSLYSISDTTIKIVNPNAPNDTLRTFAINNYTFSNARTIDILRHANFSIGAKLNLLVFDVPMAKSSYFLDIGTTLYRTAVLDSIGVVAKDSRENLLVDTATGKLIYNPVLNRYNATSLMSFLELTWQIKPDYRLGFSVSPRISYFDLKSPRFQQVAKLADTDADTGGGTPFWMFNVQVNAFILPSENGRLFFRANYTFMYDNQKQDFFQAQLGYAFNILKRKPGN